MKLSFGTIAALLVGLLSLGGVVYMASSGTVVGSPKEAFVPNDVRATPGAYRSFHFWHVGYGGYRGGK